LNHAARGNISNITDLLTYPKPVLGSSFKKEDKAGELKIGNNFFRFIHLPTKRNYHFYMVESID